MMRLELVKRTHKSRLMSVLSPLLAVAATVVFAGIVFAAQERARAGERPGIAGAKAKIDHVVIS